MKYCIVMSELLWLVRSSPTSDLTVSAFLKVCENWSGKVCKYCNVIRRDQTYCKELIGEDLTRSRVGNTITEET